MAVAKVSVEFSGSDITVRNAFLLGRDNKLKFDSNVRIGDVDYCDSKDGYVRAFAGTDLDASAGASINCFQGVSGKDVYIASDACSVTCIAIQAKGKIEPQSTNEYGGCRRLRGNIASRLVL